jgi:hypothetical protein
MKFARKAGAILIGLSFLVFVALHLMKAVDVTSVAYGSYAEAKSSQAIGEGKWLPTWLPNSAAEIKETHNIDTNETWLQFKFSHPLTVPEASCQAIPREQLKFPLGASIEKFPDFARKSISVLQSDVTLQFYRCHEDKRDERFLAIHPTSQVAYSWMLPH